MKTPSVLTQLAALSLAVLALAFGTSLLVATWTPAPRPAKMSVVQVAAALHGTAAGVALGAASAPPEGLRSPQVERALARALQVDGSRVRAVWAEDAWQSGALPHGRSVVLIGERPVLIDNGRQGFSMHYDARQELAPDTPLPPFVAALELGAGHWREVRPAPPWYDAWRTRLAGAFAVALLVLSVPVWLAARHVAGPIRRLGDAARRGRLEEVTQFPVEGPREVRATAQALNALHARLARQARERLHAFAALAHDLRMPLTGLRIRAENAPEADRQRMIADIDRMNAMLGEVLAYARLESRPAELTKVDLAALMRSVADDLVAQGKPVTLDANLAATFVEGDPALLERALRNLLDNALRYAGAARLTCECGTGTVALQVEDDGPGIPEQHLARLLAPFERGEWSRNRSTGGTGLGLAIAQRIATAHGGDLILKNRPGGGLQAALILKAMSPASV